MNTKSSHAAEQNAIYEAAMRSIEASQNRRLANGYAVVGGAIAYGQGALGQGTFGKISRLAEVFCICFAFVLPNILFIKYVL